MFKTIYFSTLLLLLVSILSGCASTSSATNKNLHGLTVDQYEYVQNETKIGGKLDFEPLMGPQFFFIIDSIAYNRKDAALLTWGKAMKELGVKSADDAVVLYEEVRSLELREPQKRALRNGFNRKKS